MICAHVLLVDERHASQLVRRLCEEPGNSEATMWLVPLKRSMIMYEPDSPLLNTSKPGD